MRCTFLSFLRVSLFVAFLPFLFACSGGSDPAPADLGSEQETWGSELIPETLFDDVHDHQELKPDVRVEPDPDVPVEPDASEDDVPISPDVTDPDVLHEVQEDHVTPDCQEDDDCDDQNPCTANLCEDGACTNPPAHDGGPCSDGNLCTEATVCMQGICSGGYIVKCQDYDICTQNTCVPDQGCVFVPLTGTPCNDGDYCTEGDICEHGICTSGPDVNPGCHSWCGDCICEPEETWETCPLDCVSCGDGVCGCDEVLSYPFCFEDCEIPCGNGKCTYPKSFAICPTDCHGCGDGLCGVGEPHHGCPWDCSPTCGNGICEPGENGEPLSQDNPWGCPDDCPTDCGNGVCDVGEDPLVCPTDCAECGDGVCALLMGHENADTCPQDCLDECGNGICAGDESPLTCPLDCGWCGDEVCGTNEDPLSCSADCHPSCGDGYCSEPWEKHSNCPQDCPTT